MTVTIRAAIERWPVAGAFVISRGAKTHVDVVVCTLGFGGTVGRAEATPIYYGGETAENVAAAIERFGAKSGRADELELAVGIAALPAGAARNALDCALWDWRANRAGEPLWWIAKLPEPRPLRTAFTISLGEPARMEADAKAAATLGRGILKLKLAGNDDLARVEAVHRGAPDARLIVDANESWAGQDVAARAGALKPLGVELIEQPVPAGEDGQLAGIASPVALCADESGHVSTDVARLARLYDVVNVKLDKAGGLTESMAIVRAARAHGMGVMVGCMLSTSLGIAPAFALAQTADWVDLDGPNLLARDRPPGFVFEGEFVGPGEA